VDVRRLKETAAGWKIVERLFTLDVQLDWKGWKDPYL
jgi:hypothetical protein